MAPWPDQLCPHSECFQPIRDLLAEMVANADQKTSEFKALMRQSPGGAITCPYCQGALEFETDGGPLVTSTLRPIRYSRLKMEARAADYGLHKSPPVRGMTPEEWVAEEKLMPGALVGYNYTEDFGP
jgi:hypothetical protein